MAALYAALPKFAQTLDEVKRQLALSQDSDEGLELMPMLLLGPPGIGAVGGNPRWLFQAELGEDVLDQLARMPPRDMRCSLMTAFGNARLARRDRLLGVDLPDRGPQRQRMGFMA
jgi:hypothetical protein